MPRCSYDNAALSTFSGEDYIITKQQKKKIPLCLVAINRFIHYGRCRYAEYIRVSRKLVT